VRRNLFAKLALTFLALLIIAAAVGLAWLIRRHLAEAAPVLRSWRAWVIWGLQSILAALVLVLLWQPAITISELKPQQNIIAILVDDSRSMAISEDGATRQAQAIKALQNGVLASLTPGKILVDMSTVSPAYSREVAAKVRAKGADMVDSPVSGSVITLQEGKLSVMVGGRAETFERIKPVLQDIGPKVTHVGDNGLALIIKIACNLSLAVQMLAFSEGVLLAEKSGIKREVAVDVLANSAIASPMIKYRGPFVLQLPAEAWFNVNMMQKDMLLALELGRQLDVPLPTTSISNEFLTAARAMGLVEEDFAVIFDVLAHMSGVKR